MHVCCGGEAHSLLIKRELGSEAAFAELFLVVWREELQ